MAPFATPGLRFFGGRRHHCASRWDRYPRAPLLNAFQPLFDFLAAQPCVPFAIGPAVDERRYLARKFPAKLPLLLAVHSFPGYRRVIGESWMHWHDYYELWVAMDGGGEYRVGSHQFAFAPGDVVLVDPLKIHGFVRMRREHAPLVVFFHAEAVAPGGGAVDPGFLSAWDRRPERVAPRLASNAAVAVHGALLRLARAWFEPDPDQRLALKVHLLEVLLHLHRAFDPSRGTAPASVSWRGEREALLGRVLEYVGQHCHTALAQPEAARVAGMSPSRFRVFFKETTGWGFGDYLRDVRLDRAARLLRETRESVAEIAYQTGFSDQSHLQRLFKAKHGLSPLAYRKQHQA